MKWFLLVFLLSGCSSPPAVLRTTNAQPDSEMVTVIEDGPGGSVTKQVRLPASTARAVASTVHDVLVLNVKRFASDPDPWTPAQSGAVVFGSMAQGMAAGSYGALTMTGQSVGWYVFDYGSFCSNYLLVATIADSMAAEAGIPLPAHRIYYGGSDDISCTWQGVATIGGNPTRTWVIGTLSPGVVGHEYGHNLGLKHSSARRCTASVLTPPCSILEYGNWTDPMGDGRGNPALIGQFGADGKGIVGWLGQPNLPPLTTATSPGTYTIAPIEASSSAVSRGVKVVKSATEVYYLQQRQNVPGLVVTIAPPNATENDSLLDMTPLTPSWLDAPLLVGQTYTDPGIVSVTLVSQDAGSSVLDVSFPTHPGPPAPGQPTVRR